MSASPSFGPSRIGVSPARVSASAPEIAIDCGRCLLDCDRLRCVPNVREHLTLADQDEREMRQRRKVAARTDRSARRDARVNAAIEQRDQRVERLEADAGEPLGQHVRAQRHRRPHRPRRQRMADPGSVAAQQVELQRLERVGRDLHVGKRSETGVDAVGRFVAARASIDDGPRCADAIAGGVASARPVRRDRRWRGAARWSEWSRQGESCQS